MRKSHRRSRGMAVIVAVAMILLVSAALLSLSVVFTAQLRRTHSGAIDSQLRQLLLAGAIAAQQDIALHGPSPRDIIVPTPIPAATLTLHLSAADNEHAEVTITAAYETAAASQHLLFQRAATNTWQVQTAQLTNSH